MTKALETLIGDLAPRVLRYCRGRLRDAAMAEEVAQEALTALVQRHRRHGPPEDSAAFVFAIARRRAARSQLRAALMAPLDALADRASSDPTPEELAIQEHRRRELRQALQALPRGEREALLLVLAGDLDYRTVAELLGISEAAVKMRLHRARRRLENLMEVCHEAI